jgi:RNA polymerase sigma factor (sigma-70 family)
MMRETSAVYSELKPIVERAIRRVVMLGPSDHDDLVQSAFERIFRGLGAGGFAGRAQLSTWATVIATRTAIDAIRIWQRERNAFRHRLASMPEIDEPPAPTTLERQLEARSELGQIADMLAGMRPEHSITVLMHDCLGHEVAEISRLTGVTPAAAQSRLVRGRRELMTLAARTVPREKH